MIKRRLETEYSPEAIGHNQNEVAKFRIFLAIIGGIMSGVLGLNGLMGFAVFLLYSLIGTLLLLQAFGSSALVYFRSRSSVMSTWQTGMMEYLLFWLLFHNIVYILS